jgi:hypothetical protein
MGKTSVNPLWLMGTAKKAFLNVYKLEKYLCIHLDILYSLINFARKIYFLWPMQKRKFLVLQNCFLRDFFLSFLGRTKNAISSQNFVSRNVQMYPRVFFSKYIKNIFS